MKRFRNKNLKLLIATDVAARGIDVDDITHVIHFALPDDPEFYAHRSGRTARAGKKGVSLALITKGDVRKLKYIASKLRISFEPGEVPALEAITEKRITRWSENLKKQEVNPKISDELMTSVVDQFEDLSKEDLIARLLTKEFNSIYKRNSIKDVNDRSKGRDDDRGERGERRERGRTNDRGKEEGMKTYFINLGRKDNINKGALLGYVCDVTGISGNDIGRIVLDGAHSFMDVKEEVASQMLKVNGTQRDGRELRVDEHHGKVTESRERGDRSGGFKGRRNDSVSGGGYKGRKSDGDSGGGYKGRKSDGDSSSSSRSGGFKGRSTKSEDSSGSRDRSSTPKTGKDGSGRSKFFGKKWD
jgi:ATP-dependent RNA helicase DeaD